MERIVRILMNRDDLTHAEAVDTVKDCIEDLRDCAVNNSSLDEAYDLVQDHLGLEADYLDDLLPLVL